MVLQFSPVQPHIVRIALLALILCTTACGSSTADTQEQRPRIDVTWTTVPTDSGMVRVAVVRPVGPGPFPAVLILHGTHGFAEEYVELARDLAEAGVLSYAACWFPGGSGEGRQFVTPIECPGAPRFIDAPSPERFRLSRLTIDSLVRTLRASADVRSLAAFGHSRGGGAVLDYALLNPQTFSALILNSTGYPDEVIARGKTLSIPVLVLHGEADGASEGGTAMTAISRARRFAETLQRSGVAMESAYYPGGHNELFIDSAQYNDSVRRIAEFLRRHSGLTP